ncbi:penicillin-binding protein 2 [Roseiterribacter gracilis]|uniref:Beta-lactamase n=1 Tax=Roseiterribacter gracilis TaxID=2812848 RepID=A0A8S8XEA7_9PROT|nr:peptidoglycan glycosyltransferase [Rhodospirillales bacterium TMPK1]
MNLPADLPRRRTLGRRAAMLGGLHVGMLGLLGARMYQLQIRDRERYQTLADENRIAIRLLAPSRGTIVDRYGTPLAHNERNFRALLVAERTPSIDRTLATLQTIVPLNDDDLQRIERDVARKRGFVPVLLRDNLPWEQVAAIEVHAPDLPGVTIEIGDVRAYPLGPAASHLLGYVSAVTEADLKADRDPILSLPGFKIGKNGVERQHEQTLRGVAGTAQVEVNAVGRAVRELARDDAQAGPKLTLTLDAELQKLAYEKLAPKRSGAAVVLDIHTGAIYALASYPGIATDLFMRPIPQSVWTELVQDPATPLMNKAITGVYAPGSTFKVATALAGLSTRKVEPDHTVNCAGHFTVGDHTFHCHLKGGHGRVGFAQAFAKSCNVFFYDVATRAGIDAIYDAASTLGLGQPSGVDLPHESAGRVPNPAWKKKVSRDVWHPGETPSVGIGQGDVRANPLQLALMVARLASGSAVSPHLTKTGVRNEWSRLPFEARHLDVVKSGLEAVCSPGGTAAAAQIKEPGMQMAGKTGSAQFRRITQEERDEGVHSDDLDWDEADHALFVGYAPANAPRYACAVVIEHGGHGNTVAAPIARDLLLEVQKRNPGAVV